MTVKTALKPVPLLNKYKHFFIGLFVILLLSFFLVIELHFPSSYSSQRNRHKPLSLDNLKKLPEFRIKPDTLKIEKSNPKCSYYDCFNVYQCGHSVPNKILIYIYPVKKYMDSKNIPIGTQISYEFYLILKAILESKYYTPNPEEACILIPSIDTLNQNRFRTLETSQALASLP